MIEVRSVLYIDVLFKMNDLATPFTLEIIATETLSVLLERLATLESDKPDGPSTHWSCRSVRCILWHKAFVKLMAVFSFVYKRRAS